MAGGAEAAESSLSSESTCAVGLATIGAAMVSSTLLVETIAVTTAGVDGRGGGESIEESVEGEGGFSSLTAVEEATAAGEDEESTGAERIAMPGLVVVDLESD